MKRIVLSLALINVLSFATFSQTDGLVLDPGVKPHGGIDNIYKAFSESYRTFNVDLVSGLYSQNAAYLVPDEEIMLGRDKIRASFQSFFDSVKRGGGSMTISFRIVQRKAEENIGYDVGIYTLRQFKGGKETGTGQGKFVVVAVKESGGKWTFHVDGYSGLKPVKTN